jgi:hypothetical protein
LESKALALGTLPKLKLCIPIITYLEHKQCLLCSISSKSILFVPNLVNAFLSAKRRATYMMQSIKEGFPK